MHQLFLKQAQQIRKGNQQNCFGNHLVAMSEELMWWVQLAKQGCMSALMIIGYINIHMHENPNYIGLNDVMQIFMLPVYPT